MDNLAPQPNDRPRPKVVDARVIVPFQKHLDGLYHGQIVIFNIHDCHVAFTVNSTDPDIATFDYSPSSLGIIGPHGIARLKVATRNKLGWGDVRKHLFLLQSIPLRNANVIQVDPEYQQYVLAHFWAKDHTLMYSEKVLLVPKVGNPALLNEPSILEEASQGYLKSRFVRLNRYFRMWYTPYELDQPLIKKDYPTAFRQLEERLWQDTWYRTFKNHHDLIHCEKQRLRTLESAYKAGWHQSLNFFICLAVLCFSVWWFWTGKISWDEHLAARHRESSWYRKLLGYFP